MSSEKLYMLFKFNDQTGYYGVCGNISQASKSKMINDIIPEEFCSFIQEENFWIGGKPESFEKALDCFKDEYTVVEVTSEKFLTKPKVIKNMEEIWEEIF